MGDSFKLELSATIPKSVKPLIGSVLGNCNGWRALYRKYTSQSQTTSVNCSDNIVNLLYEMLGSFEDNDLDERTFRKVVLIVWATYSYCSSWHWFSLLRDLTTDRPTDQPRTFHLFESLAHSCKFDAADGEDANDLRSQNQRRKSLFYEKDERFFQLRARPVFVLLSQPHCR